MAVAMGVATEVVAPVALAMAMLVRQAVRYLPDAGNVDGTNGFPAQLAGHAATTGGESPSSASAAHGAPIVIKKGDSKARRKHLTRFYRQCGALEKKVMKTVKVGVPVPDAEAMTLERYFSDKQTLFKDWLGAGGELSKVVLETDEMRGHGGGGACGAGHGHACSGDIWGEAAEARAMLMSLRALPDESAIIERLSKSHSKLVALLKKLSAFCATGANTDEAHKDLCAKITSVKTVLHAAMGTARCILKAKDP